MGSEKTSFKPKKRKAEGIANLITKLSESTGIDAKIVEKTSKKALKNFQKSTNVPITNLFRSEPHHVSSIIPLILTYFETELMPVINTRDELRQAIDVAREALEEMYGI